MDKILWSDDFFIIFDPKYFLQFFPNKDNQTSQEYENSIVRLSLYTNLAIGMYYNNYTYPLLFFISVLLFLYFTKPFNANIKEKMSTENKKCTAPTLSNPFMNRNHLSPEASPACIPDTESKKETKKFFENNLYRDVSDVFGRFSSERNFYTTPGSFSDWGDQTKFANWLYNNQGTCKIDQNYCVPYIDPRHLRKSVEN
jgi:hypothetical protein